MSRAVFPGSFDPVTLGHLDVIERAARLVEYLTVLVLVNSEKNALFTVEERISQMKYLTGHLHNVDVSGGEGLLTDYAKKYNASFILRGIRNGKDIDYELQIAEANKKLAPDIETLFISSKPEYSYLSSTIVREFIKYGANIDTMIHSHTKERLLEKITSKE